MAKEITREQAERKKHQAADFMERIGEPDRADEFDEMGVDEYAERRGFHLANPYRTQRRKPMATPTGPTKADLQDQIDRATSVLEGAYTPETNREDLAEAVGEALDILRAEDEEENEDEEDIDDDDDAEYVRGN